MTSDAVSTPQPPIDARDAAMPDFLAGGGECGRLIASRDWARTPLGPIEDWSSALRTSTALLLRSPVPIVMLWFDEGVMLYNDAYSVFAGKRHPDLLGSNVREGWPEVADFNDNVMRVGLAGGVLSYQNQELTLYRNGAPEQVWMNLDYSPVLEADGSPTGVICILSETTSRVHAERAATAERTRQRLMLGQMPGFAAMLNGPEHRFEYVNDAYVDISGERDFIGRTVRELFPELEGQGFYELLDKVYATGEAHVARAMPIRLDRADGDRSIDLVYQPVRDDSGAVRGIFVGGYDVTEQEAAIRDRSASEQRFRAAQETSVDGFMLLDAVRDADGRIVDFRFAYVNEAGANIVGQPREWFPGRSMLREMPGNRAEGLFDTYIRVVETGEPWSGEINYDRDGLDLFIHVTVAKVGDGFAIGFADRSDRRRAEIALIESEAKFQAIANSVDTMIWSTRPDGFHDYFNDRWYEYTGVPYGSTDGAAWNGMFHADDQEIAWATWRRSLASGEPYHIEYRLRHRSGAYRWVIGRAQCVRDDQGRITRWYGTCTDIHDLKVAEERLRQLNETLEDRVVEEVAERELTQEALRQAQKMEAVGQLTGGIAHDFNNLLTVVVGNIEMGNRALAAVGGDARIKRALDNAQKGAERAAALTQRLLAFSRRQPLAPKPIQIDRLIGGMSDLLDRSLGETVELEIVTSPGLWTIEADPNQLEAALLNLAVNARDAMPRGGRLTIESGNVRLDERYSAQHAEVAPGQYVVIAVTDTGAGIPREALARVFEPFFTTKEVGKGTGLGLSMVYGFVKQSGGHVSLYSEEDEGTTVKIYLPRLLTDAASVDEPQLTQGLEVSRAAETILVAEDDDDVRAYTVESLRDLGYRVLEAHDGPSALRLLERQENPIDLLFTDVVMPGMSGRELADAAREWQPRLRVLYTSGYTRNAIVHGGRLDPGVEMVAKPFTYQALARKIRDVLDAGRTRRVLVVEAEPTVRAMTIEALALADYVGDEAATAGEGMNRLRAAQGRYDVVVIDADLPDKPGEELAAEMRAFNADIPILIVAGAEAQIDAARLAGDRCMAMLEKPFTGGLLGEAIRDLANRCHARDAG